MSRYFLIFVILIPTLLSSKDHNDPDRLGLYENPTSSSVWELGLRGGVGYRARDRFEMDLGNFTSTFQPGIYSQSNTFGFRDQRFLEAIVRLGFSKNERFGFVIGELDFLRSGLEELATDRFYTHLNFEITTKYLIFNYHYIWNLYKRWGIEAGLGFGGNQTRWIAGGYATNSSLYFPQQANLRGNGISLRVENSLNYRASDDLILQFGWLWALHSIPSFSGTWNGNIATFYIQESGRTTPLAESRLTDSIVVTNQFVRALDMNSSHFGLHFSALLKFSY